MIEPVQDPLAMRLLIVAGTLQREFQELRQMRLGGWSVAALALQPRGQRIHIGQQR